MEFKTVFRHSKKFYALFALLLILAITPLALSGCGGGGGSSSSSSGGGGGGGGSSPSGTNYTVTGTVNGGYPTIANVTVTLYVPNSSDTGFKYAGTGLTNSYGSYTIPYTGGSNQDFLVMVTIPSGNTMYNIGNSSGTSNVTININELTTAQTVDSFIQSGGNMAASSAGSLPIFSISSTGLKNWYNDIPSTSGVQSFQTASVGSNLSTYTIEIKSVATALASCVQSTTSTTSKTYCSNITSAITSVTPNYTPSTPGTPGPGTLVYDLLKNLGSVQSAINSLLSYASSSNPLNLPWTPPTTLTVSTSTSTVAGTTNVFSGFNGPDALAIDYSGNVWVANSGNGTAGTASYDSNVTELSPTGSLINTYTAGSIPEAIAIDGLGNIWVANYYNVTELSPTGSPINTYTTGISPEAIAIDGSGNVWVANYGNGTVGTAPNDSNVTELNPTTGSINTYTTGSIPEAIAIDGSGNVWVVNYDGNVTELNPTTGSIMHTYTLGNSPGAIVTIAIAAIAIDGSGNVWVANFDYNTVTEIVGVANGVKTPLLDQPK